MVFNLVRRLKVTKRKVNFLKGFAKTSKEFLEISSVHGIKYIQDPETNRVSKCAWIIILIIMFGCANAMVYTFYQNFNSNPIRMNIESDHVPLTNLEFPAVTICPPTIYNHPAMVKVFTNLKLMPNVTVDEAVGYLTQVSAMVGKVGFYDETKLIALQKLIELNNMTTLEFLKLVSWKCDEMLFRCRFQSKIVNCSEIFVQSKAHLGYCCSFNFNELRSRKYQATKFGPEGGLSIILKDSKSHQVNIKRYVSSEHELIVHQNVDFPHKTLPSHSIPMGREIWAIVRPTEIVCTENFKALSVQERQCLMPYEHNMRFFKTYNSDNCEFECRVMKTFDACGCVPFIYWTNKDVKACDFTSLPCLHKTYTAFEMVSKNRTVDISSACYCPSSCQSVEYDVQVTRARLQTVVESFDPFNHGVKNNFTVLHVFMSSQVYRRLSRDTLSDIVILIGNLGSSYGLFVGISIISLLEIVYFYTLVLWRNCVN